MIHSAGARASFCIALMAVQVCGEGTVTAAAPCLTCSTTGSRTSSITVQCGAAFQFDYQGSKTSSTALQMSG